MEVVVSVVELFGGSGSDGVGCEGGGGGDDRGRGGVCEAVAEQTQSNPTGIVCTPGVGLLQNTISIEDELTVNTITHCRRK